LWHVIFFVLSAAVSAASIFLSVWSVRVANRALESPPVKLRSVESRLQSMDDLTQEHTQALTDLANRLKMIKVRKASTHSSPDDNGLPDPYKEPDRWRIEANKRLAQIKLNGG
jgi:DNA repair ATPase RecN